MKGKVFLFLGFGSIFRDTLCVCACLEMWRGTMGFADGWMDRWMGCSFFCVTASFALAVVLENQKEQDPIRNS
jgi:hypothetical protein